MSKSSSLVLGETKGNVIKLRYILSGVGSRVIREGQKWDVMKAIGVRYGNSGNVTKIE